MSSIASDDIARRTKVCFPNREFPIADTLCTRFRGQHYETLENEMPIPINLCVADCMTRDLVSINKHFDLTKAIGLMDQKLLSALPVVDHDGRVCGILSNSDLVRIAYDLQCNLCLLPHVSTCVRKSLIDALSEENEGVDVSTVMTKDVETIAETDDISVAAEKMSASGIHHLPVVDNSGKPIGIIATMDIVRAIADASHASEIGTKNAKSIDH